MEKEPYSPHHAFRNFMLINLLGYLLILVATQCIIASWMILIYNSYDFDMEALLYALAFTLCYPLSGVISWRINKQRTWNNIVVLQCVMSNAIIFIISLLPTLLTDNNAYYENLSTTWIIKYFAISGFCSILTLPICYYFFKELFEERIQ